MYIIKIKNIFFCDLNVNQLKVESMSALPWFFRTVPSFATQQLTICSKFIDIVLQK